MLSSLEILNLVSLLRCKGKCLQQCILIVIQEVGVVGIELLDVLPAWPRQNFHGNQVLPQKVVVAEFVFGVEHSTHVLLLVGLEYDNLCLDQVDVNVGLPDLHNLHDQVLDLDLIVNLELDMHGLVIVNVVVLFIELG